MVLVFGLYSLPVRRVIICLYGFLAGGVSQALRPCVMRIRGIGSGDGTRLEDARCPLMGRKKEAFPAQPLETSSAPRLG